ncbi:hypothetical protein AB7X06_16260 [Providencia rettgeri]|uniref:hypothetical protein n=1 Tax=Providencia rettgeri TaxID=587 RepID=UPI00155E2809|nr:hypothetical protein HRD55_14610 [Providencia rettgeri]QNN31968.1 hypothetical protein H9X60_14610 [Providencia rettgeri]
MNFALVTDKQSIIQNIKMFDSNLTNRTLNGLEGHLGRFKCWYAWYDEQNLTWQFGPSKLIGYRLITIDDYLNNHNDLDGKVTELQLSKYRDIVDEPQFKLLENLLYEKLSMYRKRPSANTKIYTIKDDNPMNKIKYIPTNLNKPKFYYEDKAETFDKETSLPIISSDDSEIKFDLIYGKYNYSVTLEKTSEDIYKGKAIRLGDKLEIDVSAHVVIDEYGIEIYGFKWMEEDVNYPFRVSFDAE